MKKFLLTFIVYMFSINLAFSVADGVNNLTKKTLVSNNNKKNKQKLNTKNGFCCR